MTDEKLVQMRSYWLGSQSEDERAALEDLWFESDSDVELLSAVRDDLIEDYLSNDLTAEENSKFKSFFIGELGMATEVGISAAIREAVFSPIVKNLSEERAESLFSWLSTNLRGSFLWGPLPAAVGACLIFFVIGAFWFWSFLSPTIDVAGVQVADKETPQPINVNSGDAPQDPPKTPDRPDLRPPSSPLPSPKAQDPRSTLSGPVTLVLGAAVRGEGKITEASIPKNAAEVRLLFPMPGLRENYDKYLVRVVSDSSGKVVKQILLEDLSTKRIGEDVLVVIDRPRFAVGEYKLVLLGIVDSRTESLLERGFRVKP